jgi:Protein of unknown function (DUF3261)
MHRATLIAMLAVFSASCANNPPARERAAAVSSWQLLPPSTLGVARQVNQRLRAAYGEREISVDCVVTVNADHLTVIGLVPGGPRMFTIDYDGRRVSAQKNTGVPETLQPELLLNDLQLALWPRPALQQALEHSSWAVAEPDPRTRRLTRDGKLVAEVHYATSDPWTGRTWLVNFERGYSITIDSQPLE